MKNSCLFILSLVFIFACSENEIKPETNAEMTVSPVLTLSFDHPPSSKEIMESYDKFARTNDVPNTNNFQYPDSPNEKLVILTVKTANYSNAGTDNAGHCRFIGRWIDNNSLSSTVSLILDNTANDDLDRNSYDVFYYFFNVSYSSDQFYSGRLKNTASDGWLCEYVDFMDVSCSASRETRLNWGSPSTDWVQSDGNILSPEKISSITSVLYHTNCN